MSSAGSLAHRNRQESEDAPEILSSHRQTQGKIERRHQPLKNRILLEIDYLTGDLKAQIEAFVDQYNHRRCYESPRHLTPADVHLGRGKTIPLDRERIKRQTFQARRLIHQQHVA